MLNQSTPANRSTAAPRISRADVLSSISSSELLTAVAEHPKTLVQIGFTGVVIADDSEINTDSISELGLTIYGHSDIPPGVDLASVSESPDWIATDVWSAIETQPEISRGVEINASVPANEATTLMQMSISPVPIVPVSVALLYGSVLREQRELLRSAVFWRKRFEIARHKQKLVHAGDDGLLIFVVDSWLVATNQNADEAAIDLGSYGSMWLMLASQRDVHLHGSMLILPPNSAAVVANELAR